MIQQGGTRGPERREDGGAGTLAGTGKPRKGFGQIVRVLL